MAFSLVASDLNNSGSGTSISGVALSGRNAGELVVVFVSTSGDVTVSSATAGGDAMTVGTRVAVSSPDDVTIAYLVLPSGGDKTIAMSFSGSTIWSVSAVAFAQDAGTIAFDVEGGASGSVDAGGGNQPSVVLATTVDGDLLVGINSSSGGEPAVGTTPIAYTGIAMSDANWWSNAEYALNAGTAGSKTVNFTQNASSTWALKAMAFKVVGAAGGKPWAYYQRQRTKAA